MKKIHLAGISFLFSLFLFASAVYADCGQPHGSSEPPAPSTPPEVPSAGEGGGSVGDQLGKTFEPPGGGIGTEPTIPSGGLKKYSKNSPEMRDLKKMEHQVKVDKRNTHQAKEDAGQALRDWSDAKRDVDRAESQIRSAQSPEEKKRRILEGWTASLRDEARAEQRFNEKDKAFSDSLKSSETSKEDVRQAKEEAASALRRFAWEKKISQRLEAKVENTMTEDRDRNNNRLENYKEAVRNEINAENRFEEKDREFNKALDKFGESNDRYEAMQRDIGNGK